MNGMDHTGAVTATAMMNNAVNTKKRRLPLVENTQQNNRNQMQRTSMSTDMVM